jgi:ferredoxin-fold anticodon binding domain-containing protein
MPTLQIRELPSDGYDALAARARREGRSLAQQAIAELRRLPELEAREQRRTHLAHLRERAPVLHEPSVDPEVLIREDRDR